jgi:conjugal transfer pilus assembly protein TrbC
MTAPRRLPWIHLFTLVCALVAVTAAALIPSFAQGSDGVDIDRLRKEAKERQADLSSFTRDVSERAKTVQSDALSAREGGDLNAARAAELVGGIAGNDTMGIDEMLAQSSTVRSGGAGGPANGPVFVAFASTSMPRDALKQMIRDVSAAGGVLVFRGFPNNSVKDFGAVMVQVLEKGQSTRNMGIDPRLFRAFHVQSVPTYVVTSNEVELCDGFACVSDVPPHDRLEGNVTAEYALTTIAGGGGPGSAAARVYLRRLEAGKAAG